jgi:hypothetical protein
MLNHAIHILEETPLHNFSAAHCLMALLYQKRSVSTNDSSDKLNPSIKVSLA